MRIGSIDGVEVASDGVDPALGVQATVSIRIAITIPCCPSTRHPAAKRTTMAIPSYTHDLWSNLHHFSIASPRGMVKLPGARMICPAKVLRRAQGGLEGHFLKGSFLGYAHPA
jgi:hypothetical protein